MADQAAIGGLTGSGVVIGQVGLQGAIIHGIIQYVWIAVLCPSYWHPSPWSGARYVFNTMGGQHILI